MGVSKATFGRIVGQARHKVAEAIVSGKALRIETATPNSHKEEYYMKICFAVEQDKGIESPVYGHFGSAPSFIIIDTDGNTSKAVANRDMHHPHGACNPLMAVGREQIDAVVVGGIGAGALMKLNAAGVKVFRAEAPTVKDNLELLNEGRLLRTRNPEQRFPLSTIHYSLPPDLLSLPPL